MTRGALAGAAALAALLVYLVTLSPSLGFIDWGELAAAAHGFGIPHPTGYPVFVWLAGAWSRIPLGLPVGVKLNLFSALATAAAVAACVLAAWRLLGFAGFAGSKARGAAAVASGLLLAFDRTVWSNALTLEVYPLQLLLLSISFAALLRAIAESQPAAAESAWRWTALALGLAFANHLTIVQFVPGVLLAFLVSWRRGALRTRALPLLALCLLAGALPYLYLPLRAAQDPPANWGDPRSLDALLAHVTAREFRGRFLLGAKPFLESLSGFVSALVRPSALLVTGLAALGAARLLRRDPLAAGILGLSFVASVIVASSYAIPDIASYYLLALLVVALLAGCGAAQLAAWVPSRERTVAAGVAAAASALLLFGNRGVSERGNFLVRDFADNMFGSLEPNALVISYQWDHWVSPALYLQSVEGVRRDVLIVDKRLCQRPWYARQLARRHPGAFAPAQAQLRALLQAAEADRPDANTLSARVDALLQVVVDSQVELRPVYVTMDVEPAFPSGYSQVPEGLALRLYRAERVPHVDSAVWDDFRYRPFARRDGWTDRLRQYYAAMLMGRGAFLEERGRPRPAVRYYERALGFEPSPGLRAQIEARLARTRAAQP